MQKMKEETPEHYKTLTRSDKTMLRNLAINDIKRHIIEQSNRVIFV